MINLTTRTMHLYNKINSNSILVFATIGAFLLPIQPLLILVGLMIVLDTITGLWKATKLKEKITSKKLSNIVSKMVLYQGTIITLFLLEKYLLGEFIGLFVQIPYFLTKMISVVLVGIEIMSMHENFEAITNINIWKSFKTMVKRGKEAKNDLVELTDLENKE
jgi:hypothetical protein